MFRKGRSKVEVKTPAQIDLMRAAGRVVAATLDTLRAEIRPGMTSLELDRIAEDSIRSAGAVPSFKGYHGFTGSICVSVNEEVVHGIPSQSTEFRDGDLVSIDCGAILDGWHGDSAITVAIGGGTEAERVAMSVCEEAMWRGIAEMRPGKRLGDIGHAIETYIHSQGDFGNVEEFGGHGIGTQMHMEPHVLNHGKAGKGIKLREGMCLAIEPMVTMGTEVVVQLDDGWTVVTQDGAKSTHFEHSVAITADGPRVLTARAENRQRISELGFVDSGW
ncbi:type I methionyl aminopeptidase [Spiractinospora alimapuensis]|uniref:type I methionyl aminopeptidase n=1 Tax=Spiractinospora alimapuensis TaxID=2820884 RepID=UPI001EEA1480|nr:type I methionyl aminopeptidase [Spiractinospora alimapuensis]QVQ51059.1 type I methionyl aminopeptidase [Spiractinospora alimapuensis]